MDNRAKIQRLRALIGASEAAVASVDRAIAACNQLKPGCPCVACAGRRLDRLQPYPGIAPLRLVR